MATRRTPAALLGCVSLIALGSVAWHPAAAQTQPNLNANSLLQPFDTLLGTQALTDNLNTAIAINNGSTAAQRAQAVHDNTINTDTGIVLSDGLGTRLNGIYTSALANTTLSDPNGNLVQAFRQANGISQADSGFNKYYFANGTTNGTAPSSLPNPRPNIYDQAYGVTPGTGDKFGDSRPFQVAPGQIDNFAPTITAGLVNNPAFPSGHTTYGYTQSLLFALAVPEQYQELLARASEYGNSRIVLGAHYPLDVNAGRIQATYDVAQLLNNNPQYLNQPISVFAVGNVTTSSDYAALFSAATTQLRSTLSAGCGGLSVAACAASGTPDRFANAAQNKADYESRLTYGLTPTGPTNLAPVVPTGAEVLLATRQPYLTAAQRRDVLATTELPSGGPLDDGTGWARLDLYKAADGYGAFNSAVHVTMDASKGGFNAADSWNNDIGGTGSLTKSGTGALTLTGNNSYTGPTAVDGGKLIAASGTAFGLGNVSATGGGTLVDASASPLAIHGDFLVDALSTLEIDADSGTTRMLSVLGRATLDGKLLIDFADDFTPEMFTFDFDAAQGLIGQFATIQLDPGYFIKRLTYGTSGLELVAEVPEPATMLLFGTGLGVLGLMRRRRRV